MQPGRGSKIHLDHLALGVAQPRNKVVAGERLAHVRGGEAVRRELGRIKPCAQREIACAEKIHCLNPGHRLHFRLYYADEIIGDLVGLQHIAAEAEIHRRDRLADLYLQRRLLRLRWQPVQHGADLAGDFGDRAVVIVIELQIYLDRG